MVISPLRTKQNRPTTVRRSTLRTSTQLNCGDGVAVIMSLRVGSITGDRKGGRREPGLASWRCAAWSHSERREPASGGAPDAGPLGTSKRQQVQFRRLSRTRADHVFSALVYHGSERDRLLVRTRDAECGDSPAI